MGETAVSTQIPPVLTLDRRFLIQITDADEEIFCLYSKLAGSVRATSSESSNAIGGRSSGSGLGFFDSSSSALTVELKINPSSQTQLESISHGIFNAVSGTKKGRSQKSRLKQRPPQQTRTITAKLHQDLFAVNHRKGDTGSLVWWASIDFAEFLWYDLLHPMIVAADRSSTSLLDMRLFGSSLRILELGAGTGALATLCNDMFPDQSTTSWTVSDQAILLPAIARNFTLNGLDYVGGLDRPTRYQIEEMDWISIEKDWLKAHSKIQSANSSKSEADYELILAIDCLYNESLILPLLRTFDHLSTPFSSTGAPATLVLIVSQLRSDEVMRLFVESWIALPSWKIYRVDEEGLRADLKLNLADPRYVVWCGWKVE
ncbi:hypothetical protein CROQUDRAFT_671740 [Cronartium quercuum f. sp. fusiforme G11]|uniref:Uncharacterized protein n=1 Tax=Cronartium quercuum f. sp. fusiforme G11 TaxID=708437 RepID=A0A9P6NJT2_9BASI|nr:hypothetical protein CROQUDRAFT_671740 [Cronartium quercuum f. sp. fusiforme G11]